MRENQTTLLSVAEFADALKITKACVRRWLLERKVAYIKIGRLVRIDSREIDRLLATGLHPAREVKR